MTAAVRFDGLSALVGQELGVSAWFGVDQRRIDGFAEATEDRQWIHIDPGRCARESPFGTPVAHGFLTLSLLPAMLESAIRIEGMRMGLNYGLNKVRFPAPVLVDSWVRGSGEVVAATPIGEDGVQVTIRISVQVRNQDKPGCVVETNRRRCFIPEN